MPALTRLAFQGLWLLADREGRLEDRPAKIKAQIFPYHDADMEEILLMLACGFICRYKVNGERFIQIVNFKKHQHVHVDEKQSVIPENPGIPGETRKSGWIPPCSSSTSSVPSPSNSSSPKQPQTPSAVDSLIQSIRTEIPVDYSSWRFPRGFNHNYNGAHLINVPIDECRKLMNTPRLGKKIREALEWRINMKKQETSR